MQILFKGQWCHIFIQTRHNTVIKYVDTHRGAPKNALNQMQNTNSLQNCTSNSTLTKGRTPFETAQPVQDIARPKDPRPRPDRDQTLSRPWQDQDHKKVVLRLVLVSRPVLRTTSLDTSRLLCDSHVIWKASGKRTILRIQLSRQRSQVLRFWSPPWGT